jgi:hypothetical protein
MMAGEPTGVQTNEAHAATDEFITLKYVLPLLLDEASRNRLIAEHRANPIGAAPRNGQPSIEHSADLIRVLDKLRRAPMKDKYVTVCKKSFADFRIGVCSGIRGQPVRLLEGSFSSEEACEHAIFLKRISDLLSKYGGYGSSRSNNRYY